MDLYLKAMRAFLGTILLALLIQAQADVIANDVVNDYGHVKELLGQFYSRAARRYGHDYDPSSIPTHGSTFAFDDGTEASVNRKMWTELFENDIILTLPQAEQLLKEQGSRGKRQAQPTPESFWPNKTLSYQFAHNDGTWQNLIRQALRHVESETCMRFRENGNDNDRLQFIRGSGCWSNVGKVGGRQQVSIGYGCDAMGIVAHETLHALGLWHEQSRYDRDDFVAIKMDQIIRGTIGNFEKRTPRNSDNMGQPYDLGSVMHYGPKAFAMDWNQITIQTRDWRYQQTIGQRDSISFKDAKMINLRYCMGNCPQQLSCQNEGYTDPNSCGKCRCPKGYGGTYCQSVEYTSCGTELTASSSYQTLNSGPVDEYSNCIWRIRAPAGARVEIVFDRVSFLCRDTCKSYVEVKSAHTKSQTGARFCCNPPSGAIVSDGNDMVLLFQGEQGMQRGYLGFAARYKISGNFYPAPPPLPTTTTAATTTARAVVTMRATTTTRTVVSGTWGRWGVWSECSSQCGGCGTRSRVRGCYGGNGKCTGEFNQKESCNTQACITPKRGNVCSGRILLPCDLAQKLEFGSKSQADNKQMSLPLPRVVKRNKRALKNANDQDLCEKKFTYYCPTGLLTIHIGWKKTWDSFSKDTTPTCCPGYYESNGYCYKV